MEPTEGTKNDIVEEFPPPPFYYKVFSSDTSLVPPPVPSKDPYLTAYNGAFAHIQENAPVSGGNRDFKADIKSGIKDIMSCAMELVSSSRPPSGDPNLIIEQNALNLRHKLGDFHQILRDFRLVEARENLISEMSEQLVEAKQLEASLKEALEKSRELLKGSSLLDACL